MRKRIAVPLLLAASAAASLTGCTSMSTDSDTVGLVYNAGAISNTRFDVCVPRGTKEWDGPQDKHYEYPAGQRTYRFGLAKGVDTGVISATTKDPITLDTEGIITLELNESCKPIKGTDGEIEYQGGLLQKFHEEIGNKYSPTLNDGATTEKWRDMLNDYLGEALKRAVTEATQQFGWEEIYTNEAKKAEWEKSVLQRLPRYLKQAMGDDYLTIKSVTIQKPNLPKDLDDSIRGKQVAIKDNEAQTERNTKIDNELTSIRAMVKVLGPDGYVALKAIESGRVTMMPIPSGAPLAVSPQQAK